MFQPSKELLVAVGGSAAVAFGFALKDLVGSVIAGFILLFDSRMIFCLGGILFDDSINQINLYKAMDHIRNKYGERSIMRATAMDAKTIGRFHNPFSGEPPVILAHRKS